MSWPFERWSLFIIQFHDTFHIATTRLPLSSWMIAQQIFQCNDYSKHVTIQKPLRKHKSRAQLLLSTPLNLALFLSATRSLSHPTPSLSALVCANIYRVQQNQMAWVSIALRLQLLSENAKLFCCRCHIQNFGIEIRKLEVRLDNKWTPSRRTTSTELERWTITETKPNPENRTI